LLLGDISPIPAETVPARLKTSHAEQVNAASHPTIRFFLFITLPPF